jgi:hypothetical protein
VPKPNYAFEKRQRELAKKKKKEEKAARKGHPRPGDEEGAPVADAARATPGERAGEPVEGVGPDAPESPDAPGEAGAPAADAPDRR